MFRMWLVGATLLAVSLAAQVRTVPPVYTESSVVNSIHSAAPLSLNGYVTIYGKDLSWNTRSVSDEKLRNGFLPTELGGVRVLLDIMPAHLLYVSPGQVNLLVPANLTPKGFKVSILRDGTAGQPVAAAVVETGPVLFALDAQTVLAVNAAGEVITSNNPVRPGDVVVAYCGGLGQTKPPQEPGKLAEAAAEIARRSEFKVLLGTEPAELFYAGVTPGFAGLYQVNFRIPESATSKSELRIVLGERSSQYNLLLPIASPLSSLRWFNGF